MSLRNDLAKVLARDPRYTYHAYAFVLESLEFSKSQKKRKQAKTKAKGRSSAASRHVSGQELCEGVRGLALQHYGLMAMTVLKLWGIGSTSDVGNIVYNLIASGDLEKTANDNRSDFDDVYEFENAFKNTYVFALDEVA